MRREVKQMVDDLVENVDVGLALGANDVFVALPDVEKSLEAMYQLAYQHGLDDGRKELV